MNKNKNYYFKILLHLLASTIFFSCTKNANILTNQNISVVTWNVQTFFDTTKNGTEYSEFQKKENWTEEKYTQRIQRLCEVIKQLNADVYVFQEIENEAVLYDISNFLADKSWSSKRWAYSCFSKPEDSAIGIGILSKYELSNFLAHDMDIQSECTEQPSSRYILQVALFFSEQPLYIFANHWKSKSGGEKETELWRNWQENILTERLHKLISDSENPNILICGDFNRDINDFKQSKTNDSTIVLQSDNLETPQKIILGSPWLDKRFASKNQTGSYYYNESWEKIDHFFTYGQITIDNFEICAYGPWVKEDLTPFSYNIFTSQGYSDHLPLMCKIKLN